MKRPADGAALSALAAFTTVLAISAVSLLITRPLMRAVAIIVNTDPHFSFSGLSFIFLLYVLTLAPGAILLSLFTNWLSRLVYAAGVMVLFYSAVVIGVQETAAARDMTASRWLLLILTLLAMASVYTAQAVIVWRSATKAGVARERPASAIVDLPAS